MANFSQRGESPNNSNDFKDIYSYYQLKIYYLKRFELQTHEISSTTSHEFCEVVVPGACYLEMILAGVKAHLGAQEKVCQLAVDSLIGNASFCTFLFIFQILSRKHGASKTSALPNHWSCDSRKMVIWRTCEVQDASRTSR